MIRFVSTLFALGFACGLWAQSPMEKRAASLMESGQYDESYGLWSLLAERCDSCSEYMVFARETALQSDLLDEALFWSGELLKGDDFRAQDVRAHLDLMRRKGLSGRIPVLLGSPLLARLPEEVLAQLEAEQAAMESWLSDDETFKVNRFRVSVLDEEWAAVPFQNGLVYQTFLTWESSTPLGHSAAAPERARLIWQPHRGPGTSNSEELDWFDLPGPRSGHQGPVAFNASQDLAAVTCSQLGRKASDRAAIPLEIRLFRKDDNSWVQMQFPPWNSPDFSAAHATFQGDSTLIFASNRPGGWGGMDLYRSVLGESGWGAPVNLGPAVNTKGDEIFPFAIGGDFLYFASDGHLTAGGLDVFGYRLGAQAVDRLPAPINSAQDDFAFHYDESSGEGWLSSNRNGTDAIYRVSGKPIGSEVKVLIESCDGSPLSGAEAEFVDLLANESQRIRLDEQGRWSTTAWTRRPYELRLSPIEGMKRGLTRRFVVDSLEYQLVMSLSEARMENSLLVVDEAGQPAEGVLLEFTSAAGAVSQFLTDSSGRHTWIPNSDSTNFIRLKTSLINYEDEEVVFTKPPSGCYAAVADTVAIQPVSEQVGRIDLAAILYDSGSSSLREESKLELDKLVDFLSERPNVRVELSAHTDCRDDRERNLQLSQARADACVDYIIAKGIDSSRILARGYGESQLLNDCSDLDACGCAPVAISDCVPCSEEMHQQNRRTELRILID